MGYEINWHTFAGAAILNHPLYQKYAFSTLGDIDRATVAADLSGVLMDNDSAPVAAYLSWLLRCKDLVA